MNSSNSSHTSDEESHNVCRGAALAGRAVYLNDVERLKRYIRKCSVNSCDYNGCTPLHVAVKERRRESFDYLLSLEDINLESYNFDGETPLILGCQHDDSYFAKRLIESGADVNQCNVRDISPLYYAIGNCLETAKLLLEKGADVNFMSLNPFIFYRRTPLEKACMEYNYDAIDMLLYYGAVVSMVYHSVLMDFMIKTSPDCLEMVLLHYLDEIDEVVDLDFISMIIMRKIELFPVILGKITKVDCNIGELTCYTYDVEQLVALLKKFPGFREYFFQQFRVSCFSLQQMTHFQTFTKLIFKLAEESLLLSDYLETEPGIIMKIVECYKKFNMSKVELTELILILVSYGLSVNFEDFLQVHSYFGNSFSVKLFLHNTMKVPLFSPMRFSLFLGADLMGVLLYKPNFDFNCDTAKSSPKFMLGIKLKFLNPILAFRYFANSKFHKFVYTVYRNNYNDKVLLQRPHFPKLTELSRNVLQKFIYSKYEISDEKPGKYYDIVKRLPIPNDCKQILTFDVELYAV